MKAKKRKTQKNSKKNRKLYQSLLSIYKFSQLKDFLLLKEQNFLDLCEMTHIDWNLEEKFFKHTILFKKNSNKNATPFCFECPLEYQKIPYGYLYFSSSHKISQTQKTFLKKISYFIASSLYFIKNKKNLESTKHEWELTFDSFYQSLCITDQNFQILRTNQSFRQLVNHSKKELIGSSFFKVFPFAIKEHPKHLKEYSWVSHSPPDKKDLSLKFSMRTLFLKHEKIPLKLILVKDITKEFKMEEMIVQKAKNKDLGLIKGSIAHELNNPISGIKSLLYIIDKNLHPKEIYLKKIFQDMDTALKRCQCIINKLLSVSHSEETTPFEKSPLKKQDEIMDSNF